MVASVVFAEVAATISFVIYLCCWSLGRRREAAT
jgi:hypothetical protein